MLRAIRSQKRSTRGVWFRLSVSFSEGPHPSPCQSLRSNKTPSSGKIKAQRLPIDLGPSKNLVLRPRTTEAGIESRSQEPQEVMGGQKPRQGYLYFLGSTCRASFGAFGGHIFGSWLCFGGKQLFFDPSVFTQPTNQKELSLLDG